MRTLIELLIIGSLVALTWQQSLQERVSVLTGRNVKPPAPEATPRTVVRYVQQASAPPSGEWMWDPSHHSLLDRPAYNSNQTSHVYFDAQGRSYWYDATGVKHYDQ